MTCHSESIAELSERDCIAMIQQEIKNLTNALHVSISCFASNGMNSDVFHTISRCLLSEIRKQNRQLLPNETENSELY